MCKSVAFLIIALLMLPLIRAQTAPSGWTLDNYTGTTNWSVAVTEDDSGCGGGVSTNTYTIWIRHNGAEATVEDLGHGDFSGTFSANTLQVASRSVPDSPGTSKLSAYNVIFSPDCSSFSGTYSWDYSGPEGSCSGTTQLSGTNIDSGGCPQNAQNTTNCTGLECCQYDQYKDNPECTCSGADCCQYDAYKDNPKCTCSGTDCCQYDMYKTTPLCVINSTTNQECTSAPPDCPVGGSAPLLMDPAIASGSKCRAACGPDCPNTCTKLGDQSECIADAKGECFYLCTYSNVLSCGTSKGCDEHDACYDKCAEQGETGLCVQLGWPPLNTCHCACDAGCLFNFGPINCYQWMNGQGPVERSLLYSSPPIRSGPMKSCP